MDSPPLQLSERYSFETPEQIDVSYAIAGIGSRFMAALVDTIIITAALFLILVPGTAGAVFVIGVILAFLGSDDAAGTAVPFALAGTGFLSFCIIGLYYILFEAFWQGQSPGKRWLGIRVIREGGYPIGFSTAVVRNVVRLIDFLPVYYMIGLVVMFIDRKSRRLGDLAAGTIVVKEQKGVKLETLDVESRILTRAEQPTGDSRWPAIRDVRHLTPADRSLLREFLQRRATLPPETAARIGTSLARTYALKTGHDLDGEPPESFLIRLAVRLDQES
jgi:uncharacterized RDD family membrane protein YckC